MELGDVVLAVIATDRPACLQRLLASLQPVAADPQVHVYVLDNSTLAATDIASILARHALNAAGHRVAVQLAVPGQPLHEARKMLSFAVADWASRHFDGAVFWMLDDDLVFERCTLNGNGLSRQPVAAAHIGACRLLAKLGRMDLLVGGVTGDAPVRPDAVQASQLGDLAAALRDLAALDPCARFKHRRPPRRTPDDYYDHAEGDLSHLELRYPWLPRPAAEPTTLAQFALMCAEAIRIPAGGTPFRPLLEPRDRVIRRATAPARGGNAIFFNRAAMLDHTYPALRVPGGWSRRADMIGTALLSRSGYAVYDGGPTLLHDRAGQPHATFDARSLMPEFVGVLLARVASGKLSAEQFALELKCYVHERSTRILGAQCLALAEGRRAVATLRSKNAWWHRDECSRECARQLEVVLDKHLTTLANQHSPGQLEAELAGDLLDAVLDLARRLGSEPACGREVACAGG